MYETHGNIGRGTKGKISMSRFHSIIPGPHMHGLAIESIEESQGGPFRTVRPPNNRRASKRHLSVYVAGATPTQDSFLKDLSKTYSHAPSYSFSVVVNALFFYSSRTFFFQVG